MQRCASQLGDFQKLRFDFDFARADERVGVVFEFRRSIHAVYLKTFQRVARRRFYDKPRRPVHDRSVVTVFFPHRTVTLHVKYDVLREEPVAPANVRIRGGIHFRCVRVTRLINGEVIASSVQTVVVLRRDVLQREIHVAGARRPPEHFIRDKRLRRPCVTVAVFVGFCHLHCINRRLFVLISEIFPSILPHHANRELPACRKNDFENAASARLPVAKSEIIPYTGVVCQITDRVIINLRTLLHLCAEVKSALADKGRHLNLRRLPLVILFERKRFQTAVGGVVHFTVYGNPRIGRRPRHTEHFVFVLFIRFHNVIGNGAASRKE